MSTVTDENRSALFVKVTLVYVVPGVIMFAAYAKILLVVRRHRRAVGPFSPILLHGQPRHGADHSSIYDVSVYTAKKLFIIYFVYWLMYGPKTVTAASC